MPLRDVPERVVTIASWALASRLAIAPGPPVESPAITGRFDDHSIMAGLATDPYRADSEMPVLGVSP